MNQISKTKLVLYLVAIFVAGGVTGATVAVTASKQIIAETPRPGHLEAHWLKERFHSKLALTEDQAKVVDPILEKMSEELKSLRAESTKRIGALMKSSYDQIARDLTPEQRVKLEQMKKDRAENSHRRRAPQDKKTNAPAPAAWPDPGQ